MTKRESQVVERLPCPWVGVTKGQCLDGMAEKLLSFCKFSPAQMPGTHRIVAAAVSGVAAERLAPIHVSMTRGMTILIEVQTCDIEFVVAPDFFWRPRLGRGWGRLLFCGRGRRVAKQCLPLSGFDNGAEFALLDSSRQLGDLQKSASWFQIALPLRNLSAPGLQANFCCSKCLSGVDTDAYLTL